MKRLTKIIIFSLIVLLSSIIFLILNIPLISNLIAILSSIIQIFMFVYWLKIDLNGKNLDEIREDVKESRLDMQEIKKYQLSELKEYKKREEIIGDLLREGVIPYDEINKIINNFKGSELFIVSCCGGKVSKSLSENNENFYPDRIVLNSLGFTSVYISNNLFIIFKEDLPSKFRNLNDLKRIVNYEIKNKWKEIQQKANDKFPESNYKRYGGWRDGTKLRYNLTFIDILDGSVTPLYKQLTMKEDKTSFTQEFTKLLFNKTKKFELIKNISSESQYKIKEFLIKISFKYILKNMPAYIKYKIEKNEKQIRKNLRIDGFLFIASIPNKQIINELTKYLNKEDSELATELIKTQSQEYINTLKTLGVTFN